jgi:hypothetical protein
LRGERDEEEEGVKAVLCIFKIRKEPAETRKGRESEREFCVFRVVFDFL